MAPSQRGLGVMMNRDWKGRTAMPNAPGVFSCEPRQLASEVPMRKTAGLAEAPPGSPWLEALGRADCKQLMNLLDQNSCRVVQKGEAGFTVLHAAAMGGCLKLLDQVFDLFEDKDRFVNEEEGIELSLQELLEAEANWGNADKARLTAFELAWWSMGANNCRYYLLTGERESGNFLSYQSKIFGSSIDPVAADEENSSPRHLLLRVLADHRSLVPDTVHPRFEEDVDYNFVADCKELRFHHACQNLPRMDWEEYVKAVIKGCVEKGPDVLRYLFQLRNAQGRTPLHVAVEYRTCGDLVRLIPGRQSGENAECLNMRDSRGWTALHLASAQYDRTYGYGGRSLLEDGRADVDPRVVAWSSWVPTGATPLHLAVIHNKSEAVEQLQLFEDPRTDVNARFSRPNNLDALLADGRVDVNATVEWSSANLFPEATALHLAVIHNNSSVVERLLEDPLTDVNALFHRKIYFDDSLYVSRFQYVLNEWTALQLAAVVGLPEVVRRLLTCPRVEDVGKRKKYGDTNLDRYFHTRKISAIHLAAASRDPETLRLFTTNHQFDPLVTCCGATSLYFVVASRRPTSMEQWEQFTCLPHNFMKLEDFSGIVSYGDTKAECAKNPSYKGRETCINILVQAGVDVRDKDDGGNFPEPGRWASIEYHLLWQNMVESETLEAKKSLNDADNAIFVVAALVATTSYVGPLQPPLGYANDFVQTSNLSIRIFMATNSVSFYLALASIMFALVPSLPMPQLPIPQEEIYEEWQRTRKTIGIAISLLLMSVLGVLISFTTASNAVVSEEYSWRHGGLTFYPAVVAGLVCLIGIIWLFIRLLRLIFPKSVMIRHIYQYLIPIKEKRK